MTQKRIVRLAIYAAAACGLLYFFPLVRIRPLASAVTPQADSKAAIGQGESPPDMAAYIESLWSERLPEAARNAAAVDDVLTLAKTDANGARQKFGRKVGLGGPTFLFLRGRGRVESANPDECLLFINGQTQRVSLQVGILLSNAVRDATGLVNVGDFPNSQDFNNLSAELNRRCESAVIEPVRDQLVVGAIVDFVGCGEVRDSDGFSPLKLIPVQLSTFKAEEAAE